MGVHLKSIVLVVLPSWSAALKPRTENSTVSDLNVLGAPLEVCSINPVTGWFRDGYCRTDSADYGVHVVCATMTQKFLTFTKSKGNDLSARRGGFPGLNPGDRWCLCAERWREAMLSNTAPLVVIKSTHEKTLQVNSLQELLVNQVVSQHIMDVVRKEEL